MNFCFEWDPNKAATNLRKHGVSFEHAATVFADPRALSLFDVEHGDAEDRWITLGISPVSGLLAVHHTYEQESASAIRIRIISSRKATKREVLAYTELNEQ
jgi:hypothetical protein